MFACVCDILRTECHAEAKEPCPRSAPNTHKLSERNAFKCGNLAYIYIYIYINSFFGLIDHCPLRAGVESLFLGCMNRFHVHVSFPSFP